MTKTTLPFGAWPSVISPQSVTESSPQITEPRWDISGCDGALYWMESRPAERGRNTIVKWQNNVAVSVVPTPINVRTTVNEYGGGHYCVYDGVVYFVVHDDQQIYKIDTREQPYVPQQITHQNDSRFADLHFDHLQSRLIAVREQFAEEFQEPRASIVSISVDNNDLGSVKELVSGDNFYSSPTLSPCGKQLAWVSWSHPNMPWDNTQCWIANIAKDGTLSSVTRVAGQLEESVCQPSWSPDGDLYLVSDRSNWWNIYRVTSDALVPICALDGEFAYPPWVYGLSNYCFFDNNTIVASYSQQGLWFLTRIDLVSGQATTIPNECTDISDVISADNAVIFNGGNSQQAKKLYRYSAQSGCEALMQSANHCLSADDLAQPEPISFSSRNHRKAYGFYYPPTSSQYHGPQKQSPPLLVFCHGGPTAAASSSLNLKIQFWTSRGFAVADVNYSGSTGYGRSFRHQLNGGWGQTDVEDIIACAEYLVNEGKADPNRLAIRGSSAGGFSVLAALTFHECFKAGASLYGISNLETLATDTHKFESRYMDSLIGPYPEEKSTYQARSPINHVDQLNCPVIFLQGLKDKVVPPQQAETMVKALADKTIPHAYVTFDDEAHGFRQADNIHKALLSELSFYRQVFNIDGKEPGDSPIVIHFLRPSKEQN